MPVKNVSARRIKIKKTVTKEPRTEADEEQAPVIALKVKMPVDLEESETLGHTEEKTDDETTGSETESDELGLDDSGLEEELDPFNDKWEA